MDFKQMHQDKLISLPQAAGLVQSGMTIHYCAGASLASSIDTYLAKRKDELEDVTVRSFLDTKTYDICLQDPEGKSFRWHSGFVLPFTRPISKQRGVGIHTPGTWHMAPQNIRDTLELDIAYIVTTPMDDSGHFNFGLTVAESMALVETAKTVVVLVREDMPRLCGGNQEGVHISKVNYITMDTETETFCLPEVPVKPEDGIIAENILETGLIRDGSTLQIGIGGLPNSLLDGINQSGLKHCGIHTEMMTEKMIDLIESGVVDNSRKNLDKFKTVFSFSLGSRKLYDYMDNNPAFASYAVDYTNHPMVIAQQPDMVSLNSTAQIDLTGQVASEQIGGERPYLISGTGGQLDFVMGTGMSLDKKGVSILALYSQYDGKSRINPFLEKGTSVTVPRTLVDYVATEWGVVRLKGLTVDDRARALISIAHPDHREDLAQQAEKLGVICYPPHGHRKKEPGIINLRK